MSIILEIEKRNEDTCFERAWEHGDVLVRRMLARSNTAFEIGAQPLNLMAGARDAVRLPAKPPLRLIAMRVTLIQNTSPTGIPIGSAPAPSCTPSSTIRGGSNGAGPS